MASHVIRNMCGKAVARTGATAINNINANQAHHLAPKQPEKPLMDLLPIPQGPWEDYHQKQNAKYNIHLLGGVAFFALSLGIAYSQGFLFLNALTPPLPDKSKRQN